MRPAVQTSPPRPATPHTVRVASVPAGHVYVEHLSAGDDEVVRLADPRPDVRDPQPGQWWPPRILDPRWLTDHAADYDLVHVHFGFDATTPEVLAEVVATLGDLGKPLVYTVHDLRNPHHRDRRAHDAHLDVLVPGADALITLTRGAAAEIERRWGRTAHVVPHPHVVPLGRIPAGPRVPGPAFVVGVHAKSLRAGLDPGAAVRALLPLVDELPDLHLVVDIHRDVADGARRDDDLMTLLEAASDRGALTLHVHDWYSDDELWAYLESLDLSVLPYRFGTHSGWLEAAHDLGTTVLAPDCGYFRDQQPCLSYHQDESGTDGESLRDAVRLAHRERPRWGADREQRWAERRSIAAAHRSIYAAVLA